MHGEQWVANKERCCRTHRSQLAHFLGQLGHCRCSPHTQPLVTVLQQPKACQGCLMGGPLLRHLPLHVAGVCLGFCEVHHRDVLALGCNGVAPEVEDVAQVGLVCLGHLMQPPRSLQLVQQASIALVLVLAKWHTTSPPVESL